MANWTPEQWGLAINAASSIATVLLALVAFWQIQESRREGKLRKLKEVQQAIYAPLMSDLAQWNWQGQMNVDIDLSNWEILRNNNFFLIERVPPSISKLVQSIRPRLLALRRAQNQVNVLLGPEVERLARSLKEEAGRQGAASTEIVMFPDGAGGGKVNFLVAWLNREGIVDHARRQFPAAETEFQVLAGGFLIGGTDAAKKLYGNVFGWLDASNEAQTFRATRLGLEKHKDDLVAAIRHETKD